MTIQYKLKDIIKSNKENLHQNITTFNNENYIVMKYDKEYIDATNWNSLGLIRSIIIKDDKLLCFSPPKSILGSFNKIKIHLDDSRHTFEEFIDGTMINIFWDNEWIISTRSIVGANNRFFTSGFHSTQETFNWMFTDTLYQKETSKDINKNTETNTEKTTNKSNNPRYTDWKQSDFYKHLQQQDKSMCFSFVMQHPNNRIVIPISESNIYLVAVYKIIDNAEMIVNTLCVNNTVGTFPDYVKVSKKYSYNEGVSIINDINNKYGFKYKGIIIVDNEIGSRGKIINPEYNRIKQLKNNQANLKIQYYDLVKRAQINYYLKYFPEYNQYFDKYTVQYETFLDNMFNIINNINKYHTNNTNQTNQINNNLQHHIKKIKTRHYHVNNPPLQEISRDYIKSYFKSLPSHVMYSIVNNYFDNSVNSGKSVETNIGSAGADCGACEDSSFTESVEVDTKLAESDILEDDEVVSITEEVANSVAKSE